MDEKTSIAIVSNVGPTYPGGLATYQRELARLLAGRAGAAVTFLCQRRQHPRLPAKAEAPPAPILELPPAAAHLSASLWPRFASRPPTHAALEHLTARAWTWPRDLRPTWVHFVGTGWDFTGFAAARWAARHRARFTIWPAVHPRSWGDDAIDIRLYRKAGAVFCQSDAEHGRLVTLGVDSRQLVRCDLFPMEFFAGDAPRFRAAHRLGERPVVLFLARRDRGKGYPALLEAWPRVLARVPDAVLVLAGPAGAESFAALREKLPPSSFVDLGVPDDAVKSDALAACDLLCVPSAHESFGIVYVEAWAAGKPVICGAAPASREFIRDGETGLWSSEDPPHLTATLLRLLEDPALRERLGRRGRQLQRDRYSADRFLATHLEAAGLSRADSPAVP